jgi:hypothetical protein
MIKPSLVLLLAHSHTKHRKIIGKQNTKNQRLEGIVYDRN